MEIHLCTAYRSLKFKIIGFTTILIIQICLHKLSIDGCVLFTSDNGVSEMQVDEVTRANGIFQNCHRFFIRFTNYSNYGWNKHVLTPSCWAMYAVRTVCMLLFELVLFSYRVQHLHVCKLPGIMSIFRYWSLWPFSWCTAIDFSFLESHQFSHKIVVCALAKCLVHHKRKPVFDGWFNENYMW